VTDCKMEDEVLNLKWSNHKNTFFKNLKILREKSIYTDATLAVEGKFYHVHKIVMSTSSEYFSDIFETTPCKSLMIVLKDVRTNDIEALLDYIYLGEVNVHHKDLESLLKTAECLRIKGLAIPDEDLTNISKNSTSKHDDSLRDSPPPKRRRQNSSTMPPHATSAASSPKESVTLLENSAQPSPIPPNSISITRQDEPAVIKVKIEDCEEQEQSSRKEMDYEGGASSLRDPGGDAGFDILKTEHEVEMDYSEEHKQRFSRENDYEGNAIHNCDPLRDSGSEHFNLIHKP
ncbi:unnamed protein product, partial [Meganyctiphanes norvegica]